MRCAPGPTNRQRFHIYVMELEPGVLYVGSTTKSVRERVAEHRTGTGARNSRRRSGRYRRDLSPKTVCATRERAEAIEQRLARKLRAQGWEVQQG